MRNALQQGHPLDASKVPPLPAQFPQRLCAGDKVMGVNMHLSHPIQYFIAAVVAGSGGVVATGTMLARLPSGDEYRSALH